MSKVEQQVEGTLIYRLAGARLRCLVRDADPEKPLGLVLWDKQLMLRTCALSVLHRALCRASNSRTAVVNDWRTRGHQPKCWTVRAEAFHRDDKALALALRSTELRILEVSVFGPSFLGPAASGCLT